MNALLRFCLHGALIISTVQASLDIIKNAPAAIDFPVTKAPVDLYARQVGAQTCGFKSGDPGKPRVAASGWYCATDTVLNYWGFCPGSISKVEDCYIARVCQDSKACSSGCGRQGFSSTYRCPSNNVCVEDHLLSGTETFRYFSCGATARANDIYLASANGNFTMTRTQSTPMSRLATTSNTQTSPTVRSSASSSQVSSTSTVQETSTTSVAGTSAPATQSSSAAWVGRDIGVVGTLFFAVLAYL
ncbi:hypothetical protein CC86DRAFT_463551 [Ophiobolus disseminans]|uniref:Uncharacterized protein n=1 Tax=Ophiobolus disseminans TaxID=1469910 RepID=A0A6A7AGM6_9PLEO|nr:hypothetical protein CC86DRAFT_463551 [Ophiobolus disseminans]